MRNTKYFITGGGTGGHIYPAIAIVRELIKSGADKDKIFYLGSPSNLEFQIAKNEGLNFLPYNVCAMPRKLSLKIFTFFFQLLFSTFKAIIYTLKYKPDVVFATGGYVCAPILIAASILKIPCVLHDCDACPGVVSKTFSKGAYAVSVAFESAKNLLKCKNSYTLGNPVREDFMTLSKEEARKALNIERNFVILIMGGSLGAKTINDAAIGVVDKYADSKDIQIIWQSGEKNYDDTKKALEQKFGQIPSNVLLAPYFENMAIPLKAADVAVSRAGSLSLSELCASGLPSILVPYPYAAADHQRINARQMCQIGASLYLDDNDCSEETLTKMLKDFIEDKEALKKTREISLNNAKYDAAGAIVSLINEAKENAKR